MSMLRKITSGLRSLLRKEQVDQELNEDSALIWKWPLTRR